MERTKPEGSTTTPNRLPRNDHPNQRPSNRALQFKAGFAAVVCAPPLVGVGLALGYVYLGNLIVGRPYGLLSVLCFVLGSGLGLAWYLHEHFSVAHLKREEFVRAGGDPTGITPWMFGAMGGKITEDGAWEWYSPSGSSGESSVM